MKNGNCVSKTYTEHQLGSKKGLIELTVTVTYFIVLPCFERIAFQFVNDVEN